MCDQSYDDPSSEFECPECGEELDEEEVCRNGECPEFEAEPSLSLSDYELREHERKQMGVGS